MISHIESVPPGGYLNPGLEPTMFSSLEVAVPPGYSSKPKAERVKVLKKLLGDDGAMDSAEAGNEK